MQVKGTRLSPILSSCRMHSHPCWELILNISGHGIESISGKETPFFPSSITLCPPDTPHGKRCDASHREWMDISLQFQDDSGRFQPQRLHFQDDPGHSVETLLRLLQGIYYNPSPHSRQAACAMAEAICQLILSWDENHQSDRITQQMKNDIFLHFSDPDFSVIEAMQRMNYCPDHIRRVFRQDTGITPTAYLTKIRLDHARELLLRPVSPAYSIREIAQRCGFDDPDYFCRLFHKETGCSPRDYRKGQEE